MKLMRVAFVLSMLAAATLLSGCVLVPVGPGYYSGSHGYHGAYGNYGGRGHYGRR